MERLFSPHYSYRVDLKSNYTVPHLLLRKPIYH